MEDYSMYASSMRILAGSMGIPFLPIKSVLGSDIPKFNKKLKTMQDPYTDEQVILVPALNPDVTFIHVQYCDPSGNARILGNLANDPSLARAARKTIITCEKIISEEEIRQNPMMTSIPYFCVDAVVEVPYGAHPEPVDGVYAIDEPFIWNFADQSKSREGFCEWMEEWVYHCPQQNDYYEKLGKERLDALNNMEKKFREGMIE
jgi:glutaconate CoA-transferase subunit A